MSLGTFLETVDRLGDRLLISMPAEEYWLTGRAVLPPLKTPDVLLGSSRPLYLETTSRQLCSEFYEAVTGGDLTTARERMLEIRFVADAIFTGHHVGGTHDVALTKAVGELIGMAGGPARPPLSSPPAEA